MSITNGPSRDTSVFKGKFIGVPEKMFTYITFLFEGMSLLRERNTFSGSRNPALTSIQATF